MDLQQLPGGHHGQGLLTAPGAVSYTHLDVYKRQDNDGAVRHIALTGIGEADGAEGYVLKVEAGGSHCLTALVTYAGGVYVEKGGAFALWANWK